MNDTIVAISTPIGRGAISIVRMSGQNCLNIAQAFFSSTKLDYKKIIPNMLIKFSFNNILTCN